MVRDADSTGYYGKISEGAMALPFMKATYNPMISVSLIQLPPEMMERVYMYCTTGRLNVWEMRRLYPAAVLCGMNGIVDREIVHGAVVDYLRAHILPQADSNENTLQIWNKLERGGGRIGRREAH